MTPAYARELADAWTHMDPESRKSVLAEIRSLKPHEFALVAKAVFNFYGPKAGPTYLLVLIDAVIADGPATADGDDDSDVVEDVTPITPAGTTPVPDLTAADEPKDK